MVAVVTGASSGIGRALARRLAQRGSVLALGRDQSRLDSLAREHTNILPWRVDITQAAERASVLDAVSQTGESISVLVHAAATVIPLGGLTTLNLSTWQQCLQTNVEAPIFLTQALLGAMGSTRILHISSGLAHQPMLGLSAYCVSKAAFWMAYECLKREFENKSIRIASMEPGIVDTAMQSYLRAQSSELLPEKQMFCELAQNKALLDPEVVSAFIEWILYETDDKRYENEKWDIFIAEKQGYSTMA